MGKAVKNRSQIEEKYKWDIEAMYPDDSQVEKDIETCIALAEKLQKDYAGRLTESPEVLCSALKDEGALWQLLERAYVYSHMKRDEDNANAKYQAMLSKSEVAMAKVAALTAFFTPELLTLPEEKLNEYLEDEKLHEFRHSLESTFRRREHILSEAEENILAQISEITGSSGDIFNIFNDADAKFGEITDADGDIVELTHGNYISFMESENRDVRKSAFEHMYAEFKSHINTLATMYSYNVKTGVVEARIRKYDSARDKALFGDRVPGTVYDNLIEQVQEALPALHKYMAIRKKIMDVDELHMYDIYRPMISIDEDAEKISFEQAVEMINEALQPLGDDYLSKMNAGIEARWIDVYENPGKTSGAYSFGSYDSMPYILCNYQNKLKDVFTVIHEMGHSMHSFYTRETQPFQYGDHSIFTAEVASTVNESLLMKHLLANADSKQMRAYLLNMYIEEFRTTLFRQTMFAEFEDIAHKAVESGEVLTAKWCNEKYMELNSKYFGPDVVCDDEIQYEWSRIPHFYRSFYVYKYATGYSAATAISQKILSEGAPARDAYIEFLKSGSSNYPIELLKIAGVDMGTPEPVAKAMETFKALVDEFEEITK